MDEASDCSEIITKNQDQLGPENVDPMLTSPADPARLKAIDCKVFMARRAQTFQKSLRKLNGESFLDIRFWNVQDGSHASCRQGCVTTQDS